MSTTNEKLAAEQLLHGYADVLNRADPASISSFYAFDGTVCRSLPASTDSAG